MRNPHPLKERRPERSPAQDVRQGIDLISSHLDRHSANLWGHSHRYSKASRRRNSAGRSHEQPWDPQILNKYSFNRSDPTNFVDPNGLQIKCFVDLSRHDDGERNFVATRATVVGCFNLRIPDPDTALVRQPRRDDPFERTLKRAHALLEKPGCGSFLVDLLNKYQQTYGATEEERRDQGQGKYWQIFTDLGLAPYGHIVPILEYPDQNRVRPQVTLTVRSSSTSRTLITLLRGELRS